MIGVLQPNAMQTLPSLKETFQTVKDHATVKRKSAEALQGKDIASRRRAENLPAATTMLVEELLENSVPCYNSATQSGGQTDFSGLIPKSFVTTQPDGKRARTTRTFADIATQRQPRAVLKELPSNVEYLPPPLAASAMAGTLGAQTQTAAERQLPLSSTAPIDWSLKTTARFSSVTPFDICDEAQLASSREVIEVEQSLTSADGVANLSLRQQYLASLLSFQHPQAAHAVPAGSKIRGPDAESLLRRQHWRAAFCSVYDRFRNGQCSAFYYVAPEGSGKDFVAFFGAAGVCGRQRMHAILTRSTAGARALLQNSKLGFAAPLAPGASAFEAADDAAASGTQSMLVFEGGVRVHGLFDFLLNETWQLHGDTCDVPLLLSPVPFLFGVLRAHELKVLGASGGRDTSKAQHRIELRGLLPPWVLDRLAGVFAVTQDGGFSMLCDTHPSTLSLNWQPGSTERPADKGKGKGTRSGLLGALALDDRMARARGCLDAHEAERWQARVEGLSCNVVRELRCEGGIFTARLSDKSAARLA